MKKKLVYYSVGNNIKYNKLLELSIISLMLYYNDDILIITDQKNINYLKNRKIFNDPKILFMIQDSSTIFHSTLNKMLIYKYEKFYEYECILYLDCDTIVTNDLTDIFDKTKIMNKICIVEEVENIVNDKIFNMSNSFFAGDNETLFSIEDKKIINEQNILGLNTGVFCLPTTKYTKEILIKMYDHYIQNYNLNIVYNTLEQPYMNYYLFKESYYFTLNKHIKIIHLLITDIDNIKNLFNQDIYILHFVGPGPGQFDKKYNFMLNLFPNKISKYLI